MILQAYLEGSAQERPEHPAIRAGKNSLTYRELNEFANQIAHCLRDCGLREGAHVGLYLTKSVEAIAALFGILKAGCVYVPIDPDSPPERTHYIIENCELTAVVVDKAKYKRLVRDRHPLPQPWTVLNLSAETGGMPGHPLGWRYENSDSVREYAKENPERRVNDPSACAAILYTSGSTGHPKGVMLSHTNIASFVEWAAEETKVNRDDVFSNHAPLHFDLSIYDIFACFRVGATLCLPSPGMGYFPDALARFISENKITIWYSVPSVIILILTHENHESLISQMSSIRILIYAGEVFPYKYLNQLRPRLPKTTIYNFYGPTETNVITYYRLVGDPTVPLSENVPIGRACPYAWVMLIDEEGHLCEKGETGELVVNGKSLMMGYWRDSSKTSKSIRKRRPELDDHLYHTGDLCRESDDGLLIYVNRRDHMVKTRGFRVELGEIESCLHHDERVLKAAVVAVPCERTTNRLFAYISVKQGCELEMEDLQKLYNAYLPAYMIPEKTILLEGMPLTNSGKIDRTKLRELALV